MVGSICRCGTTNNRGLNYKVISRFSTLYGVCAPTTHGVQGSNYISSKTNLLSILQGYYEDITYEQYLAMSMSIHSKYSIDGS